MCIETVPGADVLSYPIYTHEGKNGAEPARDRPDGGAVGPRSFRFDAFKWRIGLCPDETGSGLFH